VNRPYDQFFIKKRSSWAPCIVVLLLLSLLWAQNTHAFLSGYNWYGFSTPIPNDHAQITLAAFASLDYPDCAVTIVSVANTEQDNSLFPYHHEFHFDRNGSTSNAQAFADGAAYFRSQKALVALFGRSNPREALNALGRALHALQDFYAHSNFVDFSGGLNASDRLTVEAALENPAISVPNTLKLTWFNPANKLDTVNDPLVPPYPHGYGVNSFPILSFAKDFPSIPEYVNAKNAAFNASSILLQSVRGLFGDLSSLCSPRTLPITPVTSLDPNDKTGSTGSGPMRFISGSEPLRYVVDFENKDTATAPAQRVSITDQLDSVDLDLNSFSLGLIVFGSRQVMPTAGLANYSTMVDLRPAKNLLVKIEANLNKTTGLLTWRFTSLDPATGLPPTDPLAGFLPPGVGGSVLFTVSPNNLPTGTQLRNRASIVFDVNAPIDTPEWSNTIDNTKPTSHVNPLPTTQTATSFAVSWTAADVGAGVQDVTVYVSDNGGPFTAWQQNGVATSALFTGTAGHTYGFYSIARDLVGNVEAAETAAEANTKVALADTTPPVILPQITGTLGSNGWYRSSVIVNWSVTDPESGIASSSGCGSTTVTADTAGVTFTCSATNGAGLSASVPVTIKIDKTPPVISGMPAAGCILWPPDQKLVQVAIVTASDALSGLAPGSFKVTGTSNEPIAPNDPNAPDIVITPNSTGGFVVQLRADRLGNANDRIYTLTAAANDVAGNTTTATATCIVPHDQRK